MHMALIEEMGVSEAEYVDIRTRASIARNNLNEWNKANGAYMDYHAQMREIAGAITRIGYDEFYRNFADKSQKGKTLITDTHRRQHSKKEIVSVTSGADFHKYEGMLAERAALEASIIDIPKGLSDSVTEQHYQTLYLSRADADQSEEDLRAHERVHNPADWETLTAKCPHAMDYTTWTI